MKITGKIYTICAKMVGQTDNGTWVRQTIVIKTLTDYPVTVALDMLGETNTKRIEKLKEGDIVTVHFQPESRFYNDKWFTNLRAYNIDTYTENN